MARNALGLPQADNVNQGTPGRLALTGGGAGTYDACPSYNIANFMPNGATLGGLRTNSNALTVVSCNQDLRQDYNLYLTKLQFTVWNSREQSYTGAYICVDSVNSVDLGPGNPRSCQRVELQFHYTSDRERQIPRAGCAEHPMPELSSRGPAWRANVRYLCRFSGNHHSWRWSGSRIRLVGSAGWSGV